MEITKFFKEVLLRILIILVIIAFVCYIISGIWLIVWIISGQTGLTLIGDLLYKNLSHIFKQHE